MSAAFQTTTVLLRHVLADGSWHFDWMIDPGPERPLITFRTAAFVPDASGFEAERIGDHRRVYLTYEGPLSGRRGEVSRVAEGAARVVEASSRSLIVDLAFAGRPWVRWEGSASGSVWIFGQRGIPAQVAPPEV
ncbi:MAG: hypothetical protein WCK33_10585 [Phycisphaerae bacterium]|jgi:hypothetical protein